MKELNTDNKIYNQEFDIFINPYLTYAQIQQIVNEAIKEKVWANRHQIIDLLLIYHVTNLTKDEIEHIGHDKFLQSGLIDVIYKNVKNINKIYEAINYTESITTALMQIISILEDNGLLFNKSNKESLNNVTSKK